MKVKIVAHEASERNGYEIKIGNKVTYSYSFPVDGCFTNVFSSPYFSANVDYVKAVRIVKVRQFPTSQDTTLYHFPATAEIEVTEDDAINPIMLVDGYGTRKFERAYWIDQQYFD